MTIKQIDENRSKLIADEGKAIHEIGTESPTTIIGATVKNECICRWEDCDFGEREIEDN